MKINNSILYLSYNGLLEEILPSQVMPYLRKLAKKGYNFTLLTFEKRDRLKSEGRVGILKIRNELKKEGIEWHHLRYHKRMPLLATSFDILIGMLYVNWLVITRDIQIIHARGIIPAVMVLSSKLFNVNIIFDTRGRLADEYVGGGHWREGSLNYRILKFFEKRCLRVSDYIVVLTLRHYEYLSSLSWFKNRYKNLPVEIIPCCVDLDRFKCNIIEAGPLRERERLQDNFIFVYPGKIGTWYMLEEMLGFFKIALGILQNSIFMVLTQNNQKEILDIVSRRGLDSNKVVIKKPSFEEIPALLSLAHAGIFFINPNRKFSSSPIKLGEFLSCGIPVIINSGIGDTEELVNSNRVGVVVDEFNNDSYKKTLLDFLELLKEGDGLRQRCRKIAENHLSLESGLKRYESIYSYVERQRNDS